MEKNMIYSDTILKQDYQISKNIKHKLFPEMIWGKTMDNILKESIATLLCHVIKINNKDYHSKDMFDFYWEGGILELGYREGRLNKRLILLNF